MDTDGSTIVVLDPHQDAPGRLFLILAEGEETYPGAFAVIFSDHGMICLRVTLGARPLRSAPAWFGRMSSSRSGSRRAGMSWPAWLVSQSRMRQPLSCTARCRCRLLRGAAAAAPQ